jgi:NAD(P)-dependent dehydrogenase (short-subunit alcohol dehydrogenase family)
VLEFVSSVEAESLVNDGARWVPYYQRDRIRELADRDVILVEGLGMVTAATSTTAAKLARDRYLRTIEVMAGAQALGGFVSFDADIELAQARPPAELQGKVALVTGAAGGIGRAIADALSAAGACVVAFDLDGDGAQEAVAAFGDRGLAVAGDVTSEQAVAAAFAASVDAFGGVDIVVSNAGIASSAPIEDTSLAEWNRNHAILGTGYFLVAREAFRVLKRQGIGGSIVFVASKNALVAGKNAAAYSSAKAAELHLARCLAEEGGAHGIRVNTVNPDAVLRGSKIWDSSWRKGRAVAYNIEPDELDEHYRKRTTLGVNIFPEDIAEAVMHFASGARSGKSTGNVLNVDGGVPAAYAR